MLFSAGSYYSQLRSLRRFSRTLPGRLILLAALLVPDILLLAGTPHAAPLLGGFAPFGIVAYAVFLGLGFGQFRRQRQPIPFRFPFYIAHFGCLGLVSAANLTLLHRIDWLASAGGQFALRLAVVVGLVLLALACLPLPVWARTVRESKPLWLYSAIAGTLAWCLRSPLQSMWENSATGPARLMQSLTFHSVQAVLRFFLPGILVDPETFVIRAPHFAILVAEECSGLEGLGLVFVFTSVWLWYFRRENRFPQALLLIPCALAAVWTLNILRIAALVLIGNSGHPAVAMVGFHSQAGWIAFTAVALAFSIASRSLGWVRSSPPSGSAAIRGARSEERGESHATGTYLVPFLAILAASFLSKAMSGDFEWLYPLRFFAAAAAFWFSWPVLKKLDWRVGWLAPAAGVAVFGIWLSAVRWGGASNSGPGSALAGLAPGARWSWIAFRVAAAVVTVPLAEELAFRGYLARRLLARKFDSVPFSAVNAWSVGLSSVALGILQGRRWMVGLVAGLVYALVMRRSGRLSEAIAAHATNNLLLALWVVSQGDWAQW